MAKPNLEQQRTMVDLSTDKNVLNFEWKMDGKEVICHRTLEFGMRMKTEMFRITADGTKKPV